MNVGFSVCKLRHLSEDTWRLAQIAVPNTGFDFIPGQAILIEDVGSSEFLRFQDNSMQVPIMVA